MNINLKFNRKNINTKFGYTILVFIFLITIIFIFTDDIRTLNKNLKIENEAQQYLYLGEYDKAINEYQNMKTKNLKNSNEELALKNLYISKAYLLKGDKDNSQKYIDLAIKCNTKDERTINNIVFNELILGNIDKALNLGEKALASNTQNKSLIKTMIGVYGAKGKIEEAQDIIKLYNVDEKSAYDTVEYSKMLILMGNIDRGLMQLKRAWNLDKDEYKIYDVLSQGCVYDKELIINEIKDMQKKSQNDVALKMWLAKIYSLSKDTSNESLEILSTLNSEDAGEIQMQLIKAAALQNLDKDDEAEKIIYNLVKEYKNDYRVLHYASWFYLNKDNIEKAEEYCKKSIEANHEYSDNYAFLMPKIIKKHENKKGEMAYFIQGLAKEPYNYNILFNIGEYFWNEVEDVNRALEYFNMVSNFKPCEGEIKYNIGLINFNLKKNDKAIEILKECIKLNSNSEKYHRTLGTMYLTNGNNEEGIKEIKKAYDLDKDDILTLNNAACYYIVYTNEFYKGYYNLKSAIDGIKPNTNEYVKRVINNNFEKIKSIVEKIQKGKANEAIKISDFRLLY